MKNYFNVIYILTNPLYAGYVKIGYASDLNARLSSLNTGMLRNFEVYAVYETSVKNADIQFHNIIDDLAPIVRARVINGQKVQDKEFFKLEPEQAYDLLSHIAKMTDTEDKLHKNVRFMSNDVETSDGNNTSNISSKLTFKLLGIPIGSELVFIPDESIKVVTCDDNNMVQYRDVTKSLSAMVLYLKQQSGTANKSGTYQGGLFFKYNNKNLIDIRKDMNV